MAGQCWEIFGTLVLSLGIETMWNQMDLAVICHLFDPGGVFK